MKTIKNRKPGKKNLGRPKTGGLNTYTASLKIKLAAFNLPTSALKVSGLQSTAGGFECKAAGLQHKWEKKLQHRGK